MSSVFADTFYFLALLNQRDSAHQKAITASQSPELLLVTTEFVLLELGDALSKPPSLRADFQAICALIRSSAFFRLVRASSELLERGAHIVSRSPGQGVAANRLHFLCDYAGGEHHRCLDW